ncbi:hypothetical protein OCOJLMKI_5049 [Methylobacterium iners]|uniref:Uncharacterized protein n=1 Tax=Methylobacterium iners TaxID=418707 RepID=A0ABQ4S5H0_9HYPH|nr:hypothetical protein OCOJLMKI_5049 [Methylobacterium iners]
MSSPLVLRPLAPALWGRANRCPGRRERASDAGTALPPKARPVGHRTDTLSARQQVTD